MISLPCAALAVPCAACSLPFARMMAGEPADSPSQLRPAPLLSVPMAFPTAPFQLSPVTPQLPIPTEEQLSRPLGMGQWGSSRQQLRADAMRGEDQTVGCVPAALSALPSSQLWRTVYPLTSRWLSFVIAGCRLILTDLQLPIDPPLIARASPLLAPW
jgi:hypothetical protein